MKKITALIIAFTFIITSFVSCSEADNKETGAGGAQSTKSGGTQSTAEETETDVFNLLPEKDYKGYSFNVLTSEGWSVDMKDQIVIGEMTGDVVYDAIYDRNRSVEEHFNVKINAITAPYNDLATKIRQDVQSGTGAYDLIAHSPTALGPLAAEDMFLNVNELEFIHTDRPWYQKTVNSELELYGKLTMFQCDIGFVYDSCIVVMLFNRDMAYNKFNIEDLQKLAIGGGWTLDKFTQYSKGVTEDINGDTVMDENDRWGFVVDLGEYLTAFQYGMGQKVTEKDGEGIPRLALNSSRMISIVDKMNDFLYDKSSVFITTNVKDATYKLPQDMFRSGKSLFLTLNISSIAKRLRDMEDDYGVLPMPKYDEAQKQYMTAVSPGSTTLFAIPITVSDAERASVITDALAAEGHAKVVPAFVDTAVKVKYSRDDYSSQIYDMIFDGAILDFGTIYDTTGMSVIFRTLMKNNSTDFASAYSSLEAKTAAVYDGIITLMKNKSVK